MGPGMMIVIVNAGARGMVTVVTDGVVLTIRRRRHWTTMESEVAVVAFITII